MESIKHIQASNSNSPGYSLYSLASNGKLVAPIIFVITTLILGIASRGLAFVREDVMMIKLFSTYPLNVARIFTDVWNSIHRHWVSRQAAELPVKRRRHDAPSDESQSHHDDDQLVIQAVGYGTVEKGLCLRRRL